MFCEILIQIYLISCPLDNCLCFHSKLMHSPTLFCEILIQMMMDCVGGLGNRHGQCCAQEQKSYTNTKTAWSKPKTAWSKTQTDTKTLWSKTISKPQDQYHKLYSQFKCYINPSFKSNVYYILCIEN